MSRLRQDICKKIAALSVNSNLNEIEEELDRSFEGNVNYRESKDGGPEITPLMVACDRGHVACLEYLQRKSAVKSIGNKASNIIGDPLDKSPGDQNSALHHAAMAGCSAAIEILANMGASLESLGMARNSHGDTPFMMAAISGHLGFFQAWQVICAKSKSIKEHWKAWESRNNSGDSCLSLASCHGRVAVVNFLLREKSLQVDFRDVDISRSSLQRMEKALEKTNAFLEAHWEKLESVRSCIKLIDEELAWRAELAAEELLRSPDTGGSDRILHKPSKKSLQKAKRRRRPPQDMCSTSATHVENRAEQKGSSDSMNITTLPDGTLAVRVEGTDDDLQQPIILSTQRQQRSADDMFKDRFQGAVSAEVDSVMNALCLDVSMLLYTPHGMALDLSPSQLDAVQRILEKQLTAVHSAREIQERMHATVSDR